MKDAKGAGTALRVMREAAGLTVRQLAELSETGYAYLSRVENGRVTPSEDWMRRVTAALGRYLAERGEAA